MASDIFDIFSLRGRTALVTGASSGLGRHFAITLARTGAKVFVAARRPALLGQLVDEIQAMGQDAVALPLDVRDPASVLACFAAIAEHGEACDIIVNNAGVSITKPVFDLTEDDWQSVVDTNLGGSWRVAQEGAHHMKAAGKAGSIVNIASILSDRVARGVAPYVISKGGLMQLTRSLALELARFNIRVNAIQPGYIITDLNRDYLEGEGGDQLRARIPTRRFGYPEDLDGPLLLLASDAGRHVTGIGIVVDGGHLVNSHS